MTSIHSLNDFPDPGVEEPSKSQMSSLSESFISDDAQAFEFIKKYAKIIIVFWVIAGALGVDGALKFIDDLVYDITAPSGTLSGTAVPLFESYFPQYNVLDILMLECIGNCTLEGDTICDDPTAMSVMAVLLDNVTEIESSRIESGLVTATESCLDYVSNTDQASRDYLLWKFVDSTKMATYAIVYTSDDLSRTQRIEFAQIIQDITPTTSEGFGLYWMGTSFSLKDHDNFDVNMFWVDIEYALATILLVAYICSGWRLLTMIAIFNYFTTILITYGLMNLALNEPLWYVTPVTKALALVLCLIHLSWFDLHFRLAKSASRTHEESVESALRHVKTPLFTITLLLLSLCILFIVWITPTVLYEIGLCSLFIILISSSLAYTFTPAIVLTFPRFFSKFYSFPFDPSAVTVYVTGRDDEQDTVREAAAKLDSTDTGSREYAAKKAKGSMIFPWNLLILIIVLNIIVPGALKAVDLLHTADRRYLVSYESYSSVNREIFFDYWDTHMGFYDPFAIVLTPVENYTDENFPLNNDTFEALAAIREGLQDYYNFVGNASESILSIENIDGVSYSVDEAIDLIDSADSFYTDMYDELVADSKNATLLWLYTSTFGPTEYDAESLVSYLRDDVLIDGSTTFSYYLAGGNVADYDVMEQTFTYYAYINVIFVVFALAVLFITFKVYSAALRFVLFVIVPTTFSLSIVCLVYEYDLLTWLNIRSVDGVRSGPIHWFSHLYMMMFLVTVFLCFDVYLLSMTVTKKLEGHTDEAVVLITTAESWWPIASVSLSFLLFLGGRTGTEVTMECQVAFIAVLAIGMDLVVLRLIVLPALLSLLGRFVWTPRRMPKAGLQGIKQTFARYNLPEPKKKKKRRKKKGNSSKRLLNKKEKIKSNSGKYATLEKKSDNEASDQKYGLTEEKLEALNRTI